MAPSRSCTEAASTTTTSSRPEGVGDDEPLAAVDLLPGVVAAGVAPDGVGALDALGVDQPGAGLGVAALLHAQLGAHHGQDLLGDLGLFPPVEVPVHRLPRREVRRQLPPRAPGADHVEDRVHDRPARVLLRPPTGAQPAAAAARSAPTARRWCPTGSAVADLPSGHSGSRDGRGHAGTPTLLKHALSKLASSYPPKSRLQPRFCSCWNDCRV